MRLLYDIAALIKGCRFPYRLNEKIIATTKVTALGELLIFLT
jgi:hypothetical protein